MKFILNFRHNIEKYGFKCLEFGNPHPWSAIERSDMASVTPAIYLASPKAFPSPVCHVRKSVRKA
jgi:hypothetical protein